MKHFSEETRKRMSESAKKRCANPEWIKKQRARGTKLPYEEVKKMYESGWTQEEIGNKFGVSQKVVWRYMKRHNLKARIACKRNQYGEKNSYWKGGKIKDGAGYILIKKDGHHRAKKCGSYVREHILIVEQILGRKLAENEVVHHINGCKEDNNPENLAVMTKSEHLRFHHTKVPNVFPIAVTKKRFPENQELV